MALSKYQPTSLSGWTKFAIPGVLNHTELGRTEEGDTVSGKYARIQPRYSRDEQIQPCIFDQIGNEIILSAEYPCFKNKDFDPSIIRGLATTSAHFGCYMLPEMPLDSKEMSFMNWFLFWIWNYDDGIEEKWMNGILHVGCVKYVHATYLKILRGEEIHEPLPEVKEFPEFRYLCECIKKTVSTGQEIAGSREAYLELIKPFAAALQSFFECNEWYTVSRINKRPDSYSLATYHAWRAGSGGGHSLLELMAFSQGIQLSLEIRKHSAFVQMISILQAHVHCVNDILGMKKDFDYYQKTGGAEGEVVFGVVNKGEDVHDVVKQTCAKMDEELKDLIMIKQSLVDLFNKDENLIRYLDVVDTCIDGQNQAYVENSRYKCKRGYITLTRNHTGKTTAETYVAPP